MPRNFRLLSHLSKRYCSNSTPISPSQAAPVGATNQTIATRQQLYLTSPLSPGSVFFLPHGTRIFNKLVSFMKAQQSRHGFEEVITPLIYKKSLWEKSGHWENYKDDMFRVEGNDLSKEEYGLKPMNCPGHCIVFDRLERSYQDLPLRFSDFSSLHRNEASGALSGLTRVRRFHQDDGHIFCTLSQVGSEIEKQLRMVKDVYGVFGIDEIKVLLSTRPEEYIGSLDEWNQAESSLTTILESSSLPFEINEGDGAFYGPKIDILLTDHTGKQHQAATIQLDFQLPQRFQLKYSTNEPGVLGVPIMIHRAVFGSLERFMAILIDHYGGKWPFWLSPRQAIVIPVNSSHVEYANQVVAQLNSESSGLEGVAPLSGHKFHIDVDSRNETVGSRVKEARDKGYNFILMIGDKEVAENAVSVRGRGQKKASIQSTNELKSHFIELVETYK